MERDNRSDLKPCPFCGDAAEMDSQQGYRAMTDGRLSNAVAIYCLTCSAQHTACHADHPGIPVEDLCEMVREQWNRREAPPEASPENHMMQIEKLIEVCQSIRDRWGNTCVYIRRGGLQWGAVALNAQADDEKHGIFDLQAEHDRERAQHAEQVARLMKERDEWRTKALTVTCG